MICDNNYRHNIKLCDDDFSGRMINGQAVNCVSGMRYGLCRMSFNGCEVIAVYNALVYLKKSRPIYEVARYMERFRMLIGIFGCSPYKIGKALEHFGVECSFSRKISDSGTFIVSFWTGRRFLSSIHTVFCIRTENSITVYNRYNNCPETKTYRNNEDIAEHKKIIAVYTIKGA
ncbi:MAG: hypothetical protein K2J40_00335 [Ruminococcus sp.]|nr:hypothetical protein [Ruminococcus sp.]